VRELLGVRVVMKDARITVLSADGRDIEGVFEVAIHAPADEAGIPRVTLKCYPMDVDVTGKASVVTLCPMCEKEVGQANEQPQLKGAL
jgi:hypothetical protein